MVDLEGSTEVRMTIGSSTVEDVTITVVDPDNNNAKELNEHALFKERRCALVRVVCVGKVTICMGLAHWQERCMYGRQGEVGTLHLHAQSYSHKGL